MITRYAPDRHGVWCRPGFAGIAYSDGQQAEERLAAIIDDATRVDTFSPELRAAISDWPSEYHLSRARHCLLRPLGIRRGDRVLELGSGCGALTRYLGELGADVVAVEGSRLRARISVSRCRDLRCVRIHCDDLLQFETDERFDWILLIGVLEYAPLFSKDAAPVAHYLRAAARFLAPGGALVIATENQLGLKYFNGCSEDHVGIPYFGIESLYAEGTPVCFGRAELARQLESAGLPALDWLYPFPDYKLPSVILGARAFDTPGFAAAELLVRTRSRDYGGQSVRAFDEALAFAPLARNGLLHELSNSFLIVARCRPAPAPRTGAIAWSYAVNRHERFTAQTVFVPQETGGILVSKAPLSDCTAPGSREGDPRIVQVLEATPYRPGRLMLWRVLEACARNADAAAMAAAFRPWFRDLLSRATAASRGGRPGAADCPHLACLEVDGGLIDCTPFNVIELEGRLDLIDQEWRWGARAPLGHVVCRGVLHSLSLPLTRCRLYDVAEVVAILCREEGMSVGAAEIEDWLRQEQEFLEAAGVPAPAEAVLSGRHGRCFAFYPELVRRIQEVEELQTALARAAAGHSAREAWMQRSLRKHRHEAVTLRWANERLSRELTELRRDLDRQKPGTSAAAPPITGGEPKACPPQASAATLRR